jgi:hypothetical protein
MSRLTARIVVAALLMTLVFAAGASSDSIFDSKGMGKKILPVAGATRALGGAVAANLDPLSTSLLNPCAAARAKHVILTAGFTHMGTRTVNLDQEKTTVTTLFPSLVVVVPAKRFALLTGMFEEREGRVTLADTASIPGPGSIYDASYKRETSIHSVPIMVSVPVNRWLFLSAGILFSFCDMREETVIDFRSTEYQDTDDVMDTFAAGESFIGAFVLDLGRLRLGGQFRTGPGMSGSLERRNSPIGLWSTEDISLSSKNAFKVGLACEPVTWATIEGDYDRSPWSGIRLGGKALNSDKTDRWSLGIQYHGDYIWRASRYPLNFGYYREPLDWQSGRRDQINTGKITEEVFSLGTSIPMGQDRASLGLALEFGTRKAEARGDLEEKIYGISLSISAAEAWRREIKR